MDSSTLLVERLKSACSTAETRDALRCFLDGFHPLRYDVRAVIEYVAPVATQEGSDAFKFALRKIATVECLKCFWNAIAVICSAPQAMRYFATAFWRDTLAYHVRLLMEEATPPDTVWGIAIAMQTFAGDAEARTLFATDSIRDALVKLARLATTAKSAAVVAWSFANVTATKGDDAGILFSTEAVRGALLTFASRFAAADPYMAQAVAGAFCDPTTIFFLFNFNFKIHNDDT
jgi:hypothetical protein